MNDPCGQTRHCADHGWCRRCNPRFAALMSEINLIAQHACGSDEHWGELYGKIADALKGSPEAERLAELAEARATNRKLNHRAQSAESTVGRYRRAVAEWRVLDDGTFVPYDSLKEIGRISGVEILPGVRYMRRFVNAQQAEEFVERIYGLLEYWNSVTPPFGEPQSWWWEDRRAELSDVLAGRDSPGAQDSLRAQVRKALTDSGISQADVSRRLGLTQKHVSQMLTGRAVLTLAWAEQILALAGQRLEIRTVSAIPSAEGEEA